MRRRNSTVFILCTVLGMTAVWLPSACKVYHEADIAGYVKDSATGYGINGAVLNVYLSEESAQTGEGCISETSSMIYNGNPGYFTYTVIWQKVLSEYGSEGDVTDLWVHASHEHYGSKIVQVKGVNSDAMNVVPDVKLDAVVYTAQQVSGIIWDGVSVDGNGQPVGTDGVRVVLNLASTDKNPDYVAVSSTTQMGDISQSGVYTFVNVQWRDEDHPGQAVDEEGITIAVDDAVYTGTKTLQRTITSGAGVTMMDADSAIDVNN